MNAQLTSNLGIVASRFAEPFLPGEYQGVDGHGAFGGADQGVDVEGFDVVAELASELGDACDRGRDRAEVGWGGASGTGQQLGHLESAEQAVGLLSGSLGQCDR